MAQAGEGLEIEALQTKLKEIEQSEAAEAEKLNKKDEPQQPKKKTFDLKAIQEAKRREDEEAANIRVEDPLAVKLTSIPNVASETDIREQMSRFGFVESVFIPQQDNHRQNKIAIVRYKKTEDASRAVEEREVNIEFSVVSIERAIAKPKINRDRPDRGDRGDRGGNN